MAALIAAGLVTVVATLGTSLPAGFTAVNEGLAETTVGEPEGGGGGGAGRGSNNGGARGHGSGSGGDGGNSGRGNGSSR